jgi:hypothetical protein
MWQMGCIRTSSGVRWPGGVIPYIINSDDFPEDTPEGQNERAEIFKAMDHWRDLTRLKFQPHENELSYVEFVASKEEDGPCSSRVGKPRPWGARRIYCDLNNTVLSHEIGHAVGLWHEQQREDRDEHIELFLENVRSDKRGNFDRHVDDGADIGPYDYHSLMHYHRRTFAVDWHAGAKLPHQRSTAAPAVTSAGGEIHLVHLGNGSNDLWHSWSTDAIHWTPEEPEAKPIPGQRTESPPAIAEFGGALHMVYLRVDSTEIRYSVSVNRRDWSDDVGIGQNSRTTPCLAVFNNNLHMVRLDGDSNELWHSRTSDGRFWVTLPIPDQRSRATPALAVYDGQLHMVHLGDSHNDLWHSWSADGQHWTDNEKLEDEDSDAAPSLAVHNNRLHLAHTGTSSNQIWHNVFGASGWDTDNRNDNNRSRGRPTLLSHGGILHIFYRDASDRSIRHSWRDTSIVSFETIDGSLAGGSGALTSGDLAAVKAMYPAPLPRGVEWLVPILHMMA